MSAVSNLLSFSIYRPSRLAHQWVLSVNHLYGIGSNLRVELGTPEQLRCFISETLPNLPSEIRIQHINLMLRELEQVEKDHQDFLNWEKQQKESGFW